MPGANLSGDFQVRLDLRAAGMLSDRRWNTACSAKIELQWSSVVRKLKLSRLYFLLRTTSTFGPVSRNFSRAQFCCCGDGRTRFRRTFGTLSARQCLEHAAALFGCLSARRTFVNYAPLERGWPMQRNTFVNSCLLAYPHINHGNVLHECATQHGVLLSKP